MVNCKGLATWTGKMRNQGVHRSRDPVLENGRRHRRGPVTPVVRLPPGLLKISVGQVLEFPRSSARVASVRYRILRVLLNRRQQRQQRNAFGSVPSVSSCSRLTCSWTRC